MRAPELSTGTWLLLVLVLLRAWPVPAAEAAAAVSPRPIVIAHRGASGYRPEHTLGAYRYALLEGADFIEPDLVVTRDGVLIARHENLLAQVQLDANGGPARDAAGALLVVQATTDVAERPEFADRLAVKMLDGRRVGGWFSEDFTLEEIKTLWARERMPELRPYSRLHDDTERVPTLIEIITLVREHEATAGHRAGLYVELKHPTYFLHDGAHRDGSPIGQDLGERLLATLVAERFTAPERLFVQSFEVAVLMDLQVRMQEHDLLLPLVQLFGDLSNRFYRAAPYDVHYHVRAGSDLAARYGSLPELLPKGMSDALTYADLSAPEVLTFMARSYAAAIGVPKHNVLPVSEVQPLDADGDGRALQRYRLNGSVGVIVDRARAAGLAIHPYTLRREEPFLVRDGQRVVPVAEEALRLLEAGASGFFIDQPGEGRAAVAEYLRRRRGSDGSG